MNASDFHLPSVRVGNLFHQSESEPVSLFFYVVLPEVPFEDFFQVFGSDAYAGIFYRKASITERDGDFSSFRSIFYGVLQQVSNDDFEMGPVGFGDEALSGIF